METEDYVSALIRLGNDAPGTLLATTAGLSRLPRTHRDLGAPPGRRRCSVAPYGSRTLNGGEEILEDEGGTGGGANIMDFPNDAHRAVLADFLDAIEGDRDPAITGEGRAGQSAPHRHDPRHRRAVTDDCHCPPAGCAGAARRARGAADGPRCAGRCGDRGWATHAGRPGGDQSRRRPVERAIADTEQTLRLFLRKPIA